MNTKIPGDYWFARPDWGFGPYPVTAQGWLISSIMMIGFFAIVIAAFVVKNQIPDPSWLWLVVLACAPVDIVVCNMLVKSKTDPVNRISDYRAARGRG